MEKQIYTLSCHTILNGNEQDFETSVFQDISKAGERIEHELQKALELFENNGIKYVCVYDYNYCGLRSLSYREECENGCDIRNSFSAMIAAHNLWDF